MYGAFRVKSRKKDRCVYERELDGQVYLVDCSLGAAPCKAFPLDGRWELVYDTLGKSGNPDRLQGYQARIWKKAAGTAPA